MNQIVYIKLSKSKTSWKVYDMITKKPWANETFKKLNEAKEFCNDNQLTIVDPKKVKAVFEQTIIPADIAIEDSGRAKIIQIDAGDGNDNGMFIGLHSWDETLQHKDFNDLIGKKIRVTIEIID